MDFKKKELALKNFFEAMRNLRDEDILINKKDFTGQIGEWLTEMIYDGKRSTNGIQKGWDIEKNGEYIQVKTHAKSEGNNARWTKVDKDYGVQIDTLIIVVFTHDYKLKEFYNIPWHKAVEKIKLRGKITPRNELNWNAVKEYKIELDELPNQKVVQLFR